MTIQRPDRRSVSWYCSPLLAACLAASLLAAAASPVEEWTTTVPADHHEYLRGPQLHRALQTALQQAQRRILVVMFIMSSSTVADHPVRQLIEDLVAAHARGADILVILDETYREKNDLAVRQLQAAGIEVRFDGARITHTKLVIADDQVFVGSANWSAMALTGGNIESTVRLEDVELVDRLYALRLEYFSTTESSLLASAPAALLAEAGAALTSLEAGTLRRALASAGLDPDALQGAGMGCIPADREQFRVRVQRRLGVGSGWARWNLPELQSGWLVLPDGHGRFLLVDSETWKLRSGTLGDLPTLPIFDKISRRIRGASERP